MANKTRENLQKRFAVLFKSALDHVSKMSDQELTDFVRQLRKEEKEVLDKLRKVW